MSTTICFSTARYVRRKRIGYFHDFTAVLDRLRDGVFLVLEHESGNECKMFFSQTYAHDIDWIRGEIAQFRGRRYPEILSVDFGAACLGDDSAARGWFEYVYLYVCYYGAINGFTPENGLSMRPLLLIAAAVVCAMQCSNDLLTSSYITVVGRWCNVGEYSAETPKLDIIRDEWSRGKHTWNPLSMEFNVYDTSDLNWAAEDA